jgi:hypothetical protein
MWLFFLRFFSPPSVVLPDFFLSAAAKKTVTYYLLASLTFFFTAPLAGDAGALQLGCDGAWWPMVPWSGYFDGGYGRGTPKARLKETEIRETSISACIRNAVLIFLG